MKATISTSKDGKPDPGFLQRFGAGRIRNSVASIGKYHGDPLLLEPLFLSFSKFRGILGYLPLTILRVAAVCSGITTEVLRDQTSGSREASFRDSTNSLPYQARFRAVRGNLPPGGLEATLSPNGAESGVAFGVATRSEDILTA